MIKQEEIRVERKRGSWQGIKGVDYGYTPDRGCKFAPECKKCPLPDCYFKVDLLEKWRVRVGFPTDKQIYEESLSMTQKELARKYHVACLTISKAIKRYKEGCIK